VCHDGAAVNAHARRFPLVDSLRGIAALMVLALHAIGIFGGALHSGSLRAYVARLESGVVVFLLISGFLLYRPFVRAHLHAEPVPATGAYAWRRFLRIVPAYWVALLVAIVAVPLSGLLTVSGIATYFGFAQIYRASTIGVAIAPAWTLGLELTFYMFLPVWAWTLRRLCPPGGAGVLRVQLAGVMGLILFSEVYKGLVFALLHSHRVTTAPSPALVALPGYIDEFAVGMLLAVASVVLDDRPAPRAVAAVARRPWLAWLGALAAFLLVSRGIGLHGDAVGDVYTAPRYFARNALYGLFALLLILPAVLGDERRDAIRRLLGSRLLLWLGLISYGIYLWHWPVLLRLSNWNLASVHGIHPYLLWGVTAGGLSIALGAASYYLVERPALSLKRLVGRPPAMPSEAIAEPAPAAPASG
jgi:peptidoglycan/LPS O-acetylase OafA/YrhL